LRDVVREHWINDVRIEGEDVPEVMNLAFSFLARMFSMVPKTTPGRTLTCHFAFQTKIILESQIRIYQTREGVSPLGEIDGYKDGAIAEFDAEGLIALETTYFS